MIDLAEDDDQLTVGETAARLLSEQDTTPGAAAALWRQCADLGWLALALPEEAGGVGYGVCMQIMLFREIGRALAVGPFLANSLAAHAVLESGRTDLLDGLVTGSLRAALAEAGPDGRLRYFRDVEPAGILLVRSADGELHLVDVALTADEQGLPAVDPAFHLIIAAADLTDAPALPTPARDHVLGAWQVLTSAQAAGIAECTRDMSVQHGIDRVQYGRQIGSFQAVKHRCADMAVRAEAAWAATALAAVGLDEGLPQAGFDAMAAFAVASGAALVNSRDNIQNHGAIGFTEEHRAQRYVKRAQVLATSFGTTASRRDGLKDAPSPW